MHTLTEILERGMYAYENSRGIDVLCVSLFRELMNRHSLPNKIQVTVSTRPIDGAARVPVKIGKWGDVWWIDWGGDGCSLYGGAVKYLYQIGVRRDRWTDVWIDWAPIQLRKDGWADRNKHSTAAA